MSEVQTLNSEIKNIFKYLVMKNSIELYYNLITINLKQSNLKIQAMVLFLNEEFGWTF